MYENRSVGWPRHRRVKMMSVDYMRSLPGVERRRSKKRQPGIAVVSYRMGGKKHVAMRKQEQLQLRDINRQHPLWASTESSSVPDGACCVNSDW
nr:hypothetical protein CFP56_29845 [Quercus suber]